MQISYSYLHITRLSADGCFKMKQRERGIEDVEMDTGGSYIVEENRYRRFLDDTQSMPKEEVSNDIASCDLVTLSEDLNRVPRPVHRRIGRSRRR
jgi:hypothetical protein